MRCLLYFSSLLIQILKYERVNQTAVLNGTCILFCFQNLHSKIVCVPTDELMKRVSDFIEISSETSHPVFILSLKRSKDRFLNNNNLSFGLFNYLDYLEGNVTCSSSLPLCQKIICI